MARPWSQRPLVLTLAAAGGVGALVPVLSAERLGAGGLALPALVVLVALLIGLPVARAERISPVDPTRPLGAATRAVGETVTVMLGAAALAPVAGAMGPWGLVLIAFAWAAVGFGGRLVPLAAAALVGLGLLLAAGGATLALVQGPGWTLLDPTWSAWERWVGPAIVGGLVLAGAGLGHWPRQSDAASPRAPVAVLGLGTLALTALVLRRAAPFEARVLDGVDAIAGALELALVPAAALLLAARPLDRRAGGPWPRRLWAGLGLGLTALLAGPAADALPLWWTVVLPLGLAASLALRALAARGPARWALLGGALVAASVPVVGWPGLPDPWTVAAIAALPVLAVWIAGTRALRTRSA